MHLQKNIAKEVFVKKTSFEQNKSNLSKSIEAEGRNRVFNEAEFLELGQYWLDQGLIPIEDLTLIQKTLADKEARKLLELWSFVFPVSMTVNYFRDSATATVGVVTQNIWKSLQTYFGAFLGLSTLQGGFAAYYLRGLKSQKIVPWMYFIPILGAFAPIGYLTKEHGPFLRLLWAYLHSKNTFRHQNKISEPSKLQAHINKFRLQQNFAMATNRISPILKVTDKVWQAVQKILPKKNNADNAPRLNNTNKTISKTKNNKEHEQ